MKKGIIIKGKHSYNDFGLEIGERNISFPQINRITESVPYQNGEYDFSSLNGEITYGNRDIKYSFDIAELTTEEMEIQKDKISMWLNNIIDEDILDDYIQDYHFKGSLKKIDWKEDFGSATLEITFSVHPYKYSNDVTEIEYIIEEQTTIQLNTDSAHSIIPIITCEGDIIIEKENNTYALTTGTYNDLDFSLDKENLLVISGPGKIKFSFVKEVM